MNKRTSPLAPTVSECTACPRLATFLADVKSQYPSYYCKPVLPFGDAKARLLVVGLAPGMHGANASGRPFTGDYAGILLYETLHKFGFGSRPVSTSADDGLKLIDCRITNAVKCLPPANKPETDEIKTCNYWLKEELHLSKDVEVFLALGLVAHKAMLMALGLKQSAFAFGHGAVHELPDGRVLVNSYHCSRYNTNTGRLTEATFHDVFRTVRARLDA
ncbi:MAG TPA: uracil-DNA glycosylase [Rhodocyclaceae bacterium]|nr:uracil-DNA glycosylase [Rhodocyclaceae bacterium]